MATERQRIAEQGVLTLPEAAWEQARQRLDVVGPLAALDFVGHQAADDAAHSLGLSRRQVYVLIRRARQGSGLVTDLARGQSSGGKGKGALIGASRAHHPRPVAKAVSDSAEAQRGGAVS